MKKRILAAVFACFMALALTACGESESQGSSPTQSNAAASQGAASDTSKDDTAADAGDLGDFHAAIKDCTFGEDYEGNRMIVIHYDFTNNSADSATALWSLSTKAYQDGVELETAIALDDSVYNAGTAQKEIKPGVTLEDCQVAYTLTSSSPVEFEMAEFVSFSDEKLEKVFNVQ